MQDKRGDNRNKRFCAKNLKDVSVDDLLKSPATVPELRMVVVCPTRKPITRNY